MDVGKHVYVQKPLCWSVQEARHLAQKAKATKVVTQMGNQGHSFDGARTGYEYITNGAIGDIKEVHVWTNRPLGYWPQGIPRPTPMPASSSEKPLAWNGPGVEARLAAAMVGNYPVPDKLSWDLFLGVAPFVEYHPIYHPFNWRGWVDWGQGALGDMGAHLIDHPFACRRSRHRRRRAPRARHRRQGRSSPCRDSACGRSSKDAEPSSETTTTAKTEAAGSFGDLKDVCGPGDAKGATATGVTDTSIAGGVFSDPGFTGRPGLNQELFDAAKVFAA